MGRKASSGSLRNMSGRFSRAQSRISVSRASTCSSISGPARSAVSRRSAKQVSKRGLSSPASST